MRVYALALLAGAVVEGLFAWMLLGTGWGPCGPGSPLGMVGMLAHLFPGFFIGLVGHEFFHAPAFVEDALLVGGQLCFWVFISWLILRHRLRPGRARRAGQ